MKAFENDQRLSQHSDRWSVIQKFFEDIESETAHARKKFVFPGAHLENDLHNRSYWLSVITEEIGKLCQTANKLQIAKDESIVEGWEIEGYHRIITSVSLLRRLAENWYQLPNR